VKAEAAGNGLGEDGAFRPDRVRQAHPGTMAVAMPTIATTTW
jgi:hypothetical protein